MAPCEHFLLRVSTLKSVKICNLWASYHLLLCALYGLVHSTLSTPTGEIENLHIQSPYSLSSSSNLEDKWYKIPAFKEKECFAVQSSVIVRNGINFPSEKLITEINSMHKKLVEAIDLDVNVQLYEWNNPFSNDKAEFLSKPGKKEQLTLGKQFAHKLLSLYGNEDIGDLTFLTSSRAAPKESSQLFYSGFFDGLHGEESDGHDVNDFDTDVDDKLLRHFNRCPSSWKAESSKESRPTEFIKFLSSDYVESVREKISEKLGIQKDVLTKENVWHMYLVCGYEQANLGSSPWCSLFEEDDMDILEYLGDLKLYYDIGYGTNKTWPHGCLLLTEIFTAMEEAIDEIEGLDINEEVDGYTVGLFAFAEAETVATFMSILGLFNDTPPLQADNFESHRQRNFHGGKLIPFSSNVMLILYECAPEDYKTAETSYFVKLFVNEKATLIPGCSSFYCPFQQITKHFEYLTEDCHSKKFCGSKPPRDEL